MSHGGTHAQQAEEPHGLTPRQYVGIGLALTVITIVELAFSLWIDIGDLLIPVLIVLSAVKFVVVTRVFAGSFFLAGGVLLALSPSSCTSTSNRTFVALLTRSYRSSRVRSSSRARRADQPGRAAAGAAGEPSSGTTESRRCLRRAAHLNPRS